MGLNIKNERVHELVRRLAEATGQSQTSAIEDAVRRRLFEVESTEAEHEIRRRARMRAATERARRLPELGPTTDDVLRELYDESGMPR